MKISIICYVPSRISYLGKVFAPEISAKMLSTNQMNVQNKLMKQLHFLHVDTNS